MKKIIVDICILGAGSAGMGAFYALKDSTYKVALVDKLPGVGGTAVQGWVMSWIPGGTPPYLRAICEKLGFSKEQIDASLLSDQFIKFAKKTKRRSLPANKLEALYDSDIASALNTQVFKNFDFVKSEISGRRVESIVIENNTTNEKVEIIAKCFIDSSGDGVLSTYQGVLGEDFLQGTDPMGLFHESLAPQCGNTLYLNEPSLLFKVDGNAQHQSPKNAIETKYRISPKESFLYNGYIGSGNTDSEKIVNPMTGINLSGVAVLELGADRGRTLSMEATPSYWLFVQEEVQKRIEAKRPTYGFSENVYSLSPTGEFAPMLGIREGKRVICDYMLTQNDLITTITPSAIGENIAYGCHTVDFHVYGNISPAKVGDFNKNQLRPSGIPYRTMIPKRFDNVLVACRAYGASHIALAARRVNKDMAQLGWAAGHASKWCLDKGMTDIDYRQVDVAELQGKEYTEFAESVDYMVSNLLDTKFI